MKLRRHPFRRYVLWLRVRWCVGRVERFAGVPVAVGVDVLSKLLESSAVHCDVRFPGVRQMRY